MKRFIAISCFSALIAVSCGGSERSEVSAEASVKLYVFDCGKLRVDAIELFGIGEDETDVRELIVPCYIIEHDEGRLLWDGGLPSSTADVEGWHMVDGSNLRMDRTFADQLSDMDLTMSDFDYAAFSHLHFDHCGVANELDGATLIIQKPEFEAAFADPVTVPFFEPALYSNLKQANRLIIDGDHDVFGDGSVRIVSAPGHTPGHQVLFLDLPNSGPIALSGDLYHFRISREKRIAPEFNYDAEMTLESMEKVEKMLEETGSDFWIEHDLAGFETLKKAPLYYD
jgi:glyoxylase-like metal-dependent hydrolase (beta-lactamase superfamily II)